MDTVGYSTNHIEYLGKDFLDSLGGKVGIASLNLAPLRDSRFLKIKGITDFWKPTENKTSLLRLIMEDLISGLFEGEVPFLFGIFGKQDRVEIAMGTWAEEGHATENRLETIRTSLKSAYHGVELEDQGEDFLRSRIESFSVSGLLTGMPSQKSGQEKTETEQMERLIRGLYGRNWGYLVLAVPANNAETNRLYNALLNEERLVINSEKSAGVESPIGKQYKELLNVCLQQIQMGKAQGLWHYGAFLFAADSEGLHHVKAVAKSVFGGRDSLPDRIRTFVCDGKIENPGFIKNPPPEPPGKFQYPYSLMSTVHSASLASLVQLPGKEVPGFRIGPYSRFDVSTSPSEGEAIIVGEVLDQGNPIGNNYTISLNRLTKHGFIAGTTGSGKTNTVFHLLKEADQQGIPFLVIEPTKKEYRSLLNDPDLAERLTVFTLGNERAAPFRLNPFEVVAWPDTSVGVHLDFLRSVFTASFGMWTPMPQVLEQCLHSIYEDRGWDIASNTNSRLEEDSDITTAFPTLSDLITKVDEVIAQLGYDREASDRIRAALRTRINSLRTGGKGRMLDVRRSIPMKDLLKNPLVLELEDMGDDDDKAFVMGLLLICLAEHRRSSGGSSDLRHLLVIEEAHRLLANVGQQSRGEEANPRGKAVESFANLLSEIRAYGQGVLVADQVPVKLASDVIKNTNLKIAHRIVAKDDRTVLAGAMVMKEEQTKALATFRLGEAAVFSEGDDAPFMIRVPLAKGRGSGLEEEGENKERNLLQSGEAWRRFVDHHDLSSVFLPYPTCGENCVPPNPRCADARKIAEVKSVETAFEAFVLSFAVRTVTGEASPSIEFLNSLIPMAISPMKPFLGEVHENVNHFACCFTHSLYRFLEKRGAQYGWKNNAVSSMVSLFLPPVLSDLSERPADEETEQSLTAFCSYYKKLSQRSGPFYGCTAACQDTCYFRYAVEPFTKEKAREEAVTNIFSEENWEEGLEVLANDVTDQIYLFTEDINRLRANLCYVIQCAAGLHEFAVDQRCTIVDTIIERARGTLS